MRRARHVAHMRKMKGRGDLGDSSIDGTTDLLFK
jgi:hypothetical protein